MWRIKQHHVIADIISKPYGLRYGMYGNGFSNSHCDTSNWDILLQILTSRLTLSFSQLLDESQLGIRQWFGSIVEQNGTPKCYRFSVNKIYFCVLKYFSKKHLNTPVYEQEALTAACILSEKSHSKISGAQRFRRSQSTLRKEPYNLCT